MAWNRRRNVLGINTIFLSVDLQCKCNFKFTKQFVYPLPSSFEFWFVCFSQHLKCLQLLPLCNLCSVPLSISTLIQFFYWRSEPAVISSTNQISTLYSTKAGQHLSTLQLNKTKKHLWASSELGWKGASLTSECYAMWWRMKQNMWWVDNKPAYKTVVRLLSFK